MRDTMLILHFIGLAMGLGTAFAHAFLGFASSKLSKDEAIKLKSNTKILGRMGSIGLILLLVSGVYLILPFWNALAYMPMLQIKLRSEEHTSELQSRPHLVCRLLLEKKNGANADIIT